MSYNLTQKVLFCSVILIFGFIEIQAQEANLVSGGTFTGSGGSVSYSVGQVVYTSNTGTSGSVTQGVQQPYEISVVTGIEDTRGITLQYFVYPNPVTDYLTLYVENFNIEELTFQLYDTDGRLIENNKVKENETRISMSNFVPATYLLRVILGDKIVKTFKIIKY